MLNVDEFAQLSSQDVPRAEVCNRLMQRLAEATGADAAVLWNCAESKFRPVSKHLVEPTFQLKMSEADHCKMLSQVVTSKRSILLRPEQPPAMQGQSRQTATQPPLILLAPLPNPSYEVIELIVPSSEHATADKELMSTLQQAVEIASVTDEHSPEKTLGLIEFDVVALSKYVHGIHGSLEKKTTTSNIANETRLLLDCDRVVVLSKERGKFRISAISGQPSINRRSNTVRLLEKLAALILRTEKDFWYPTNEELPRQLKSVIDEYMVISATRSLVIKPIFEKAERLVEDPESNERSDNRVIGGLIFEHCNEQWNQEKVSDKLSFVHEHASNSLRNASQHNGLFLYPLWNLLSKSRILTAPRILPKTLMALAAIALVSLLLIFWRVPFYVSADGVFVPQQRAWVYAGQSGDIEEVLVEHGANVHQDQVLATMANRQLELAIVETQGRIDILVERQHELEKKKFSFNSQPDGQQLAEENINSIKAEIKALQDKLGMQQQFKERTKLFSPIAGQVLSWDVKQKLVGRTVRPEQQLIEVANVDGPWILELDVADRRAGHLLRGIADSKGGSLAVKFTLAAEPDQSYEGYVTKVGTAMHFTDDNQQMIRVEVAVDNERPSVQQARSGVTAKIYTGYDTSIGYLWLHDIPEAFHRYVSFYFAR